MACVGDVPEVLLSRLARSIPPIHARPFLREYLEVSDRDIQVMEENEHDFETRVFRLMLQYVQQYPRRGRHHLYETLETAFLSGLFTDRWYQQHFPDFQPIGSLLVATSQGATVDTQPTTVISDAPPPGFNGQPIINTPEDAGMVLMTNGHSVNDLGRYYAGKLVYKRHMISYELKGRLKRLKWKWRCNLWDDASKLSASSDEHSGRAGALQNGLTRLLPQLTAN